MEQAFNRRHSEITSLIIESFFNVYNKLGFGFLESVYERALVIELAKKGLQCSSQFPIKVLYDAKNAGNYFADILVNACVVIEITPPPVCAKTTKSNW